jgi:hypothetical protein
VDKKALASAAKINMNAMNAIFQAMGWPEPGVTGDCSAYLPLIEELKGIKAQGAKSWAEAVGVYQAPQRRTQLIALLERYQLPLDQVESRLVACGFTWETLTEPQIQMFEGVCQHLQAGQELAAALETIRQEQPPVPMTALAVAGSSQLSSVQLPPEANASIQAIAAALAPEIVGDVPTLMAQQAVELSLQLEAATGQTLVEAVFAQSLDNLDPDAAVEMYRQLKHGAA